MLHIFRNKKFQRRTLLCILILIIPAFVLWGAGNLFQKPVIIGTIGGEKISPDEFMKSLSGMKAELLLSYFNDYQTFSTIMKDRPLLNRMAWDRLIFLHYLSGYKKNVSDSDVLLFISRLIEADRRISHTL